MPAVVARTFLISEFPGRVETERVLGHDELSCSQGRGNLACNGLVVTGMDFRGAEGIDVVTSGA